MIIADHLEKTHPRRALLLALAIFATTGSLAASAQAIVPTKFVLSSRVGSEVNLTEVQAKAGPALEDVCTVASRDKCAERAEESGKPGGFVFPESVAVAPDENIYVADQGNHRVQELAKNGEFVLMFGAKVDKTTGGNLCTAASRDECQAGEDSTEGSPEQISQPQDIAVDPNTNNVYVLDYNYHRADEFTENGEFVLMIGGDVNETTGGDLCTQEEITVSKVKCKSGVEGTAHSAFKPEEFKGGLLAVGGPEGLLYVGDEGRVQELKGNGEWVREVSLSGIAPTGSVTALTVDSAGDLFVSDSSVGGVHEFSPSGVLQSSVIDPERPAETSTITGLGMDSYGRLGIIEEVIHQNQGYLGYAQAFLYGTTGARISEFGPISESTSLAFAVAGVKPSDRLYVVEPGGQQVEMFTPVTFPEVFTLKSGECGVTAVAATSAVLCGEVDPNGLAARAFFDYGAGSVLGSRTPVVFEGAGEAFLPISFELTGLLPNQAYGYEAIVEAEVEGEEKQTPGGKLTFHTLTPAPEVPGPPAVSFVRAQSVVLGGFVNPEHADTHYHFVYAPCAREDQSISECGEAKSTEEEQSAVYGAVPVAEEARGLEPATSYAYRLIANNAFEYEGKAEGGEADGVEGHFTTGAAPMVEAFTGDASGVTATGANVSGTVDPDGQPATYSFELGVYNGGATRYGIVSSGPAGAGTVPTEEQLSLTGLQPGTTYAYRIAVRSGYGARTGETMTFTTLGVPAVLSIPAVLAQLPVPNVAFPVSAITSGKTTPKKLTRAQELANALKVCAKKSKKQRAGCRRSARKRYGAKTAKKR